MENPVQSVAALNPQKVGTAVCEFLRVSCDMETLSSELLDSTLSLLKALRCANIVYRQGDKWIPFASLSREGYFSTRTARYFNSKGEPQSSTYTVVTQKGRWWLRKKLGLEQ